MAKTKINAKINSELKNKTVLITGGAGSIGSELAKKILEFPVDSLRIFDVDEHALFQLGKSVKDSRLRLLLGDTQNVDRVDRHIHSHQARLADNQNALIYYRYLMGPSD